MRGRADPSITILLCRLSMACNAASLLTYLRNDAHLLEPSAFRIMYISLISPNGAKSSLTSASPAFLDSIPINNLFSGTDQNNEFGMYARMDELGSTSQFVRLTGRFSWLYLCWSPSSRKCKFIMKSFLSSFCISCLPKGDKCATSVKTSVLIPNDSNVLQWPKLVKSWEYVFFVQCFRNLGKGNNASKSSLSYENHGKSLHKLAMLLP